MQSCIPLAISQHNYFDYLPNPDDHLDHSWEGWARVTEHRDPLTKTPRYAQGKTPRYAQGVPDKKWVRDKTQRKSLRMKFGQNLGFVKNNDG